MPTIVAGVLARRPSTYLLLLSDHMRQQFALMAQRGDLAFLVRLQTADLVRFTARKILNQRELDDIQSKKEKGAKRRTVLSSWLLSGGTGGMGRRSAVGGEVTVSVTWSTSEATSSAAVCLID